jgi:FKBP-type peptidyl-prolyl cis-trans isomerase SlyD
MSIINKDKAYVITYCIKDKQGKILEESPKNAPLTFYPGDGSVLSVIEKAVVEADKNIKLKLTVQSKDAFGEFDPFLIFQVNRRAFQSSEPLELHQSIYANTPKGKHFVRITKITKDIVTVNGNHELAGKTLFVDIDIVNAE